ncbi:acyl carrier protein [Actinomadura soli]|uniref:Acyl carrier protein n=1 Tax=Actinomadura soli TaxID=2508997 RepID=A0A5C4JE09_9ACTN|nr:acyl carrier protein [Actinomadura soli]TMR02598.1 acyl carrier protein [Actinomadura soli]
MALDAEQIYTELRAYVSTNFLEGGEVEELNRDTPLLEWGVLNSMNTSILMSHIRDRFGVDVPPMYITGTRFRDLGAITEMVHELSLQAA